VNRVTLGPGRERGLVVFVRGESAIRARVSASPGRHPMQRESTRQPSSSRCQQTNGSSCSSRRKELTSDFPFPPTSEPRDQTMAYAKQRQHERHKGATTPTQSTDKQRSSSPETGRKMATNSRPARVNRCGHLYSHASPKGNIHRYICVTHQ
jgi:hypothetical protein